MYFQLPWFLKRAVAKARMLQKMTVTVRHMSFTDQIFYRKLECFSKLEILQAELSEFDISAFTETWLSPSIDTNELLLHSFNTLERKDRTGDSHGGVIIYVKDSLCYKRCEDLEPRNIESIWLELTNNRKHVLFGLFYPPPPPRPLTLTLIIFLISKIF